MTKLKKVKVRKHKTTKPKTKPVESKMVEITTFDNKKGIVKIWVKEEDL